MIRTKLFELKIRLIMFIIREAIKKIKDSLKIDKLVQVELDLKKDKNTELSIEEECSGKNMSGTSKSQKGKQYNIKDKAKYKITSVLIKIEELDNKLNKTIELKYKGKTKYEQKLCQDYFYKGVSVGLNSNKEWESNRKDVD